MRLTILNVAYPFAPVGPDAVGGAEQVLTQLDAALVREGHRSIVIASGGSASGTLLATGRPDGQLNEPARRLVRERHRRAIYQALTRWQVDLVHLHGVDFHAYLPPAGVPALVTLHLPPTWYPPQIFKLDRPRTYLHCVSASAQRSCPSGTNLLPPIENGVPVLDLFARHAKRNFALALGRICPEKGFDVALESATQAGSPLLIAGEVFNYEEHQRYFKEQIVPRLGCQRRFLGPVGFKRKRRLLTAARCVLIPSLVAETSSLVAMEALACGTPVIAFPSGALKEIVEPGKTGFLVNNAREMASAIAAAGTLDSQYCRRVAQSRFSTGRMTQQYLSLYRNIVEGSVAAIPPVPAAELHGA